VITSCAYICSAMHLAQVVSCNMQADVEPWPPRRHRDGAALIDGSEETQHVGSVFQRLCAPAPHISFGASQTHEICTSADD
jgi:hypothetical protein